MANIFFTSDLHLGHKSIIKGGSSWGFREFKDVHTMNMRLINNINERVKKEDILYDFGDMTFRGGWQGGKERFQYWEDKINGRLIRILGNHDLRNGAKGKYPFRMIAKFSHFMVLMQHWPPLIIEKDKPPDFLIDVPEYIDFVLCGHCHVAWKHNYKILKSGKKIPIINVGIDMWNYRPVKLDEILNYYNKIKKGV